MATKRKVTDMLEPGTFGIFPTKLAKGLPATHQSVLAHLWSRANSHGTCFPSLQTIADDSGVSKRTVQRVLNDLEARGLIRRKERMVGERKRGSNYYVLLIPGGYSHSDHGGV